MPTYSKSETFSGDLLASLIERLESARPVYDGLRQSLEYLDEHQLKANQARYSLISSARSKRLKWVERSIPLPKQSGTSSCFGIHQAVPKTRNDELSAHSLIESGAYTEFISSSHPHLQHAVDPNLVTTLSHHSTSQSHYFLDSCAGRGKVSNNRPIAT